MAPGIMEIYGDEFRAISITALKSDAAQIVADLDSGPMGVTRHKRAVAIIMSPQRYRELFLAYVRQYNL
jgi:hypothetical protein